MELKNVPLDTWEGREKFIRTMPSDLYAGHNVDGEEVQIRLQQGEGMQVWTRHHSKPKWWEVITYDKYGFQESVTYKPYGEEVKEDV